MVIDHISLKLVIKKFNPGNPIFPTGGSNFLQAPVYPYPIPHWDGQNRMTILIDSLNFINGALTENLCTDWVAVEQRKTSNSF
jgi:hypothetical protein